MSLTDIESIILVGGKGTRLQRILNDRPKPMAIVAGKPFAEWLLVMLYNQGIRRAVMCTGYLSEAVETHFRKGQTMGMEIVYSHDPFPLGTGGALRYALSKTAAKRFFVINGDSYCRLDLSNFLKTHQTRNARASLILVRVEDCGRYGSVKIDRNGAVQGFLEKSYTRGEGLINAGIYLLEREVLEEIPEGEMISLEREVFPKLIGKGLYAVLSEGPFIDIGTPESYTRAEEVLKDEFEYLLLEQKFIRKNPVSS